VLNLVLPKGSLEKQVLELFDAADLTVIRGGDRDYQARVDDPRIVRVRFLRPQEIPTYVEQGIFDLGISGRDWVTETGADVVSLGEIGGGRAGEAVVKVVLAVPKESPWQSVTDLPEGVRISTEMPETTRRFLEQHGVRGKVFTSHGATEAKIPDIVDAIVDLTETGSSLRKAGLKIIETLLTSRTELLAHRASYEDPAKRAAMDDLSLLLQGALRARGHVLLKLNVPASGLAAVLGELPAMSSPTVMPLAVADMRAVETVVPKRGVNTLIPALKAAGARDILELPISKIVE
jgi:ATP phosphoribosyltransferase